MRRKKFIFYVFLFLGISAMFFNNTLSTSAKESRERDVIEEGDISDSGETVNGEYEIIDKVLIRTNGTPKVGDPVSKLEFFADDNVGYYVKSFSPYTYYNDDGTSDGMGNGYEYNSIESTAVMNDKLIYEYSLVLRSENGYEFSRDVEVEIDDPNASVYVDAESTTYCYVYVAYHFGFETINDININAEGISVGNTIDDVKITYKNIDDYYIVNTNEEDLSIDCNFYEYDSYTGSTNFSGTFKEGKSYIIELYMLPRERHIFADDINCNVTTDNYQATSAEPDFYSGEGSVFILFGPLCEHKADNVYQSDSNEHWKKCSKCQQIISEKEKHIFDNYRDEACNLCNYKRTIVFPDVNVSYRTHVQTYGWEGKAEDINTWKKNGAISGTTGQAKRLEGINIKLTGNNNLGIQYTTHCQSYGWLPWSSDGDMNGTEGESKRLEAIKIQLTGRDSDMYDVYYRVHAQSYGWLGWAKNGEASGTAGLAKRLEGIQVVIVKKGEAFDKNVDGIKSATDEAYVALKGTSPVLGYPATDAKNPQIPGHKMSNISYRTHVQSYGWQGWKYNGAMSGTSGKAKRLEGIEIKLSNQQYEGDIVYTTHVQSYGWQGKLDNQSTWSANGAMSGTSGKAKRLEAICINLTGEMAVKYDVYYRVHAQSYGWLGWAKNGAPAGTAGLAKRLEGIQVIFVDKGSTPPDIYDGVRSDNNKSYIEK